MPSRVWNLSPRSTPAASASMAAGWSPAGANSETSSIAGMCSGYRRPVTATRANPSTLESISAAERGESTPELRLLLRGLLAQGGPHLVDLTLELGEGAAVVDDERRD